jgi:hypothetical protein
MRGLGKKQRFDSYLTSSKIVYTLAKQPFTYYQLRRITKIHGEILRRRLDDLASHEIVIKFKYTLGPKNRDNTSKNINPAVYKYDYYLLNWSNAKSKEYFDYYSNYSPECIQAKLEEEEEDRKFKELESIKNKPLEKLENETENEFNNRKVKIELLRQKYETLIEKHMKEIVERQNEEAEKITEDAIEMGSSCAKIGHSPLNHFVALKIYGLYDSRENYYRLSWEAMQKAGLLDRYVHTDII